MIILNNVNFSYSADKKTLNNISAKFEDGKTYAVIGRSGSGKSTFLKLLNGLLKPQSGTITVNGTNITKKSNIKALCAQVGMVFQYPEHQLFAETVFDDIAFGPRNLEFNEDEVKKLVKSAMDTVSLSQSLCECSPFKLSGGEKRRAAIAGVLAMNPQTLVLDEPSAGLDMTTAAELYGFLKSYNNGNRTVIIASHSMEEAAELADEILVLSDGEIALCGTPTEIFSDTEKITDAGLLLPQTTELTLNLKQCGFDIQPSFTLEETEKNIVKLKASRLNGAGGGNRTRNLSLGS